VRFLKVEEVGMNDQLSFSTVEYGFKRKQTKREKFLQTMEEVVPWVELCDLIEPFYPKGIRGRPPIPLEIMLRVYFVQNWFGLSDEGVEEGIIDSMALRHFCRCHTGADKVPDATTLLKFRHLLEAHELTAGILQQVNQWLSGKGLMMKEGTLMDATLIAAPSSTKNSSGKRDPEMHQTKKGNQWYFGMKGHIGVDMQSGAVHSVVGTAANVSDVTVAHELLHGQETDAVADSGYQGVHKREEVKNKHAKVRWYVAEKRSKTEKMREGPIKEIARKIEKLKAQIRARAEHPFHIVKNLFGYRKTQYRGLRKNTAHLRTLFALANLVIMKRAISALAA